MYRLPDLLLDRPRTIATLVRCLNCGLVYQNPRPSLAEMGQHYPAEYESYDPSPNPERMSWLARQAYLHGQRKRSRAVTRFMKSGRLLDVGCATGDFLAAMQRKPGWSVCGVEINDHAAAIARRQHGLEVFSGTLEQAAFEAGVFDAVTLWDVFEHLHDPRATLREIHRLLRPGGALVIRVPNLDSWDARLFGPVWAGLDAPRHTYVFSRSSLKRMLAAEGFHILRMRSEMGGYPVFVLSLRFWMTRRGIARHRREGMAGLLYHPLSRLLAAPIFYLQDLAGRGPLLTVTAERRGHSDA